MQRPVLRVLAQLTLALLCVAAPAAPRQSADPRSPNAHSSNAGPHPQNDTDSPGAWPTYGGDPGGRRYSPAVEINRDNIGSLHQVWEYHTGALHTDNRSRTEAAFEATPVLHDDALFLSTPFDEVVSLDAATGSERWRFNPNLRPDLSAGVYTSRGVAFWSSNPPNPANPTSASPTSASPTPGSCEQRIFIATLDARLIALDAGNGHLCPGFGHGGTVDLRSGVPTQTAYPYQEFGVSSPPTVVGDNVIIGSAVADGQEVDVEPGVVRAYSARTGQRVWSWDPLPWAHAQAVRTGAGNTWSVISADLDRHLVFLPTGSPSPDFYGGMRPGDDRDADSVVALNADTGQKVWAFQVVHHDLWDYDVAAQPLLFDFHGNIPAIAITTKMGMIFVLNRLTGQPLIPVTERPVPQSDVPGETTSPTQPFSALPPLSPLHLSASDLPGHTLADASACIARLSALRNEGIFTPPSLKGSLLYPGSLGGVNWGSPALDPGTGILYVNSNHHAFHTRLIPRWRYNAADVLASWQNWIYAAASLLVLLCLTRLISRRSPYPGPIGGGIVLLLAGTGGLAALHANTNLQHFGHEIAPQRKSPYAVERAPLEDGHGLPCTPVPWGKVSALNLNTGQFLWSIPLGSMVPGANTGSLNLGGPIVTAGGLVFDAAGREPLLRAYDAATGETLWTGGLPVPAQSTPMTYTLHGRQFVVVSAGGHGGFGTPQGDSVVAFALNPARTSAPAPAQHLK